MNDEQKFQTCLYGDICPCIGSCEECEHYCPVEESDSYIGCIIKRFGDEFAEDWNEYASGYFDRR